MTSREQFEAWFKSDYHPDKTGPYIKDIMFVAWKASREAVEVDFPPPEPDRGTDSQVDISAGFSNRMRTKCIEYIRAAGIKVKGE